MAEAFHEAQYLDGRDCRRAACERFSAERMVGSFLDVYETLCDARSQGIAPVGFPITSRLLSGLGELRALEPAWRALWEASPDATPFQHPAWMLPWAEVFAADHRVLSMAFHRGGELVGLAPLYIRQQGTFQILSFLGLGHSDQIDVLAAAGQQGEIVEAFLQATREMADWDHCDLGPLPDGARLCEAAGLAVGADLVPDRPHPVVTLPASEAALRGQLPVVVLEKLHQARANAVQTARVSIETVRRPAVDAMLGDLFRPPGPRWSCRAGLGPCTDDVRSFHLAAAPGLLAHDLLRLYVFRLDDRVAGVYYGLQAHGRAYCYAVGFDPSLSATLSPANQLVEYAIGQAVRDGLRELDFLRGSEAYRYQWGASDRPLWRLLLKRPSVAPAEGSPRLAATSS
jgi:hypothetical protein